jgi:hypothetical protein
MRSDGFLEHMLTRSDARLELGERLLETQRHERVAAVQPQRSASFRPIFRILLV